MSLIGSAASESSLVASGVLVIHAVHAGGRVWLWGESGNAFTESGGAVGAGESTFPHPFAAASDDLKAGLSALGLELVDPITTRIEVALPSVDGRVFASSPLSHVLGREAYFGDSEVAAGRFEVPAIGLEPGRWAAFFERLADVDETGGVLLGPGVRYFELLTAVGLHLMSQQRFVPMLRQDGGGALTAAWSPWMNDEATAEKMSAVLRVMPGAARSGVDDLEHDAWAITESYLNALVDAECRRVLDEEDMFDTVEGRDAVADPQVAWMQGLLGPEGVVPSPPSQRTEVARRVRRWIGSLEDRGQSSDWRLLFRLNEPLNENLEDNIDEPDDSLLWSVSFHLQSQERSDVVVDAADVWLMSADAATVEGLALETPQELMLGELGRSSRLYKPFEGVLNETEPIEINLPTKKAYEFLREVRPILVESGFGVEAPNWWESPTGRLGARLKIDADPLEQLVDSGPGSAGSVGPQLGLTALVGYHWEIAIGDATLTLNEFEQLAQKNSPLIRVNGRWVEVRPEDVQAAIEFIRENPGGEMKLAEAMRLAYASDARQTGVPILGLDASGWVDQLLGGGGEGMDDSSAELVPILETPERFKGTLRPYQIRGLSWLAFLERFGFGACLADDMGLGKTVQLLALMSHEREAAAKAGLVGVLPTLLVVPMSVVGNWVREAERFTPHINVLVHHGVERKVGDELIDAASSSDMVVTTYALANRDRDTLEKVAWGRIVLDEAQFIKNPSAKQSMAVRSLQADKRIALTGTPVENRLSELWSIMDFLNPGYLGPSGTFRKKFSVPIERYRDAHKGEQLRGLVRPFILRRVKTDPTVVADLPEKLETREWTHLTSEQAALYESCVKRMLTEVEQTDGIHRRGLVLAALIRLKQICNHPSQVLKDVDAQSSRPADPSRSGKCTRLMEMVDEVLAEGERCLIFTQFRQMGHLLAGMLRHEMGRDVLFLHGGTPQGQRQKMIDTFQDPDSNKPILILSLKAGGVGLNLTAATHVFHFDRWWNPAVENQATDRAYRIGQTRTVHVHKFVVRGTLEERVDEMIEAKTELAERIIGAGERWLTELDTSELRNILTLRADAIGDEEA
ncbi:MAG: DEAD/DEAH box helicase [Planctomycetota bacterium]